MFTISCQKDPCYSVDQFKNSYAAFFEEFKKASKDLSEEELQQYDDRYKDLVENCYKKFKKNLKLSERQDFWKSSVIYYMAKKGGIFNINFNTSDKNDPLENYISSELEEVAEESGEEFKKILEGLLENELPKLIDSVLDKFEEIGEDLKESLKEK
jgi:hypothetical protein